MGIPAIQVRISNYYRTKQALEDLQRTYRGRFRDVVKSMLVRLRNYASFVTHRETGTLARSHSIEYDARRLSGYIYPSPRYMKVRGLKTIQNAEDYAIWEHARGGDHAFYQRALAEMGPRVGFEGVRQILSSLPRGVHR